MDEHADCISKTKLLEWLNKFIEWQPAVTGYGEGKIIAYQSLIKEIEAGTFDI